MSFLFVPSVWWRSQPICTPVSLKVFTAAYTSGVEDRSPPAATFFFHSIVTLHRRHRQGSSAHGPANSRPLRARILRGAPDEKGSMGGSAVLEFFLFPTVPAPERAARSERVLPSPRSSACTFHKKQPRRGYGGVNLICFLWMNNGEGDARRVEPGLKIHGYRTLRYI